jgi:hypothetical protein
LKNGNIIAIIKVPIIAHTTTITIGSIAVERFFTTMSISLLYLSEIFNNNSGNFHVCSHILTIEANSIGNILFFIFVFIFSIPSILEKSSQEEIQTVILSISFL